LSGRSVASYASCSSYRATSSRSKRISIDDLGAESIGFLDLLFRLEELLGKKIPIANLEACAHHEANGPHPVHAFTVRTLAGFARSEAGRQKRAQRRMLLQVSMSRRFI
jgi:hypothetical protein